MEQKRILITGASGFIGSRAVDKALELGYETWAGIRPSSSKVYLQDERIRFIDLNYGDKKKLKGQLREFIGKNGRFDYIVHCAGITKAIRKSEFDKVNFEQVRNFADALVETNAVPDLFVFMKGGKLPESIARLPVYHPSPNRGLRSARQGLPDPDASREKRDGCGCRIQETDSHVHLYR